MEMKEKRKKTVLIAMDESIQSTVAAYLLKKQGLNCIGISFVFLQDQLETCFSPLIINDVKHVKSLCKKIEIKHYAVDASDLFKDKVIDNMVAAKLAGQLFNPVINMNEIIFELLLSKMKKLNADFISSGHFARIIFNQEKKSYGVGVANDAEYDESYGLASLTNRHLEKMILPLSDIKYDGIHKIAKLIGLKQEEGLTDKSRDRQKVYQSKDFNQFVESASPPSLREKGDLRIYGEDGNLAEHTGVHHFYIGQSSVVCKSEVLIDKKLEVILIIPNRETVYLSYPEKLKYTHCQLSEISLSEGLDISLPLKVYFHLPRHKKTDDKVKGQLILKNGRTAFLILESEEKGLICIGSSMVFYDKRKEGGKIIGYGRVKLGGFLYDGRLRTLPLTTLEEEKTPANKLAPLDISLKF